MSKKLCVLIAGGSGPLGQVISRKLKSKGHEVRFLSVSREDHNRGIFRWEPSKMEMDHRGLEGVNVIINLAGAGVADKRWTPKRKKVITDSRINSTRLLAAHIQHSKTSIRWISASAIGMYPAHDTAVKTESSAPGSGFLSQVCSAWEKEALAAENASIVRIGVVLSKQGGFLEKMRPLAKWNLLSPLGNGQQYISWIHEEDVANIFVALAEGSLPHGIYNATAPNPVNNKDMLRTYARLSGSLWWAPAVPALLIKLMFGEMAEETVFSDQKVLPQKLIDSGFSFQFPYIEQALQSLIP